MRFLIHRIIPSLLLFYFIKSAANAADFIGDTGDSGCGGGSGSVRLCNPLASSTITEFLQSLLNVIMVFAVPLIVFMIIYAGFTYVMARGNESEVGKAHRALLYAVIGGVIILGANAILAVIQGTVDSF